MLQKIITELKMPCLNNITLSELLNSHKTYFFTPVVLLFYYSPIFFFSSSFLKSYPRYSAVY